MIEVLQVRQGLLEKMVPLVRKGRRDPREYEVIPEIGESRETPAQRAQRASKEIPEKMVSTEFVETPDLKVN